VPWCAWIDTAQGSGSTVVCGRAQGATGSGFGEEQLQADYYHDGDDEE